MKNKDETNAKLQAALDLLWWGGIPDIKPTWRWK